MVEITVAGKKTRKAIEAIVKALGQELEAAHRTAWGLLNAVTYHRPPSG